MREGLLPRRGSAAGLSEGVAALKSEMADEHSQEAYGAFVPNPPGPDGQAPMGVAAPAAGGAGPQGVRDPSPGGPGPAGLAGGPAGADAEAAGLGEGGAGGPGEAGEPGEGAGPAPDETALHLRLQESLQQELAQLREQNERLSSQLLRLQADFDNYRRRVRSDQERAVEEALGRLAGRLLPVVDNLERALAVVPEPARGDGDIWTALVTGLRMVHQELLRVLADEGIQRIPAAGELFDPTLHQAVERVSVAEPEQDLRVLEELQPGYRFRGRVLRPSLVRVAVFKPAPHQAPQAPAQAGASEQAPQPEPATPADGPGEPPRGDGAAP